MNSIEIKQHLESIIVNKLKKFIDSDYIYLDLPFHDNSGDVLIWQGTIDFLRNIPHQSLGGFSAETFDFPEIPKEVVILLHGGGNFGDLYSYFHNFKLDVVMAYPNNKIIFLPQTIYYKDSKKFEKDMLIINSHKNIVFCARDKLSFKLMNDKKSSQVELLLLPDMAFCMAQDWFVPSLIKNKKLYMKRIDGELGSISSEIEDSHFDRVADWPTYSNPETFVMKKLRFYLKWLGRIQYRAPLFATPMKKITNNYGNNIFREHIIRQAIEFINEYDEVTTTRLHGCILSVLLGKQVSLIDNSYGKNSNFYEAWLSEYDNIVLINKENGYVN